jgi:uncharacterized protein (TIGR03790 family)
MGQIRAAAILGFSFCLFVEFYSSAFAEVVPESTVVVINADSEASKTVASEYIKLRCIPKQNAITLSGIPDQHSIDVNQFRKLILTPLLSELDKRQLRSKVNCVAYSSDFPTAIDVRSDTKGMRLPRVLTPTASINSLTFLYERVLAKDVGYLNLNSNRYFRRLVAPQPKTPLSQEEAVKMGLALQTATKEKDWAGAEKILRETLKTHPDIAALHYNLACTLVRQEKLDEGLAALESAAKAGWRNHSHATRDEDLKSLRTNAKFKAVLKKMAANTVVVSPSLPFSQNLLFARDGSISQTDGESYLLSTVLGITRGRGNSVEEVVSNLRRSAKADGSAPAGTIYLMTNRNVRSTTRDGLFNSVAAQLETLGVKAEIVNGTIPIKKADVAGAVIGTASFDWKKSESKILPGAICEHLTSFGGIMRKNAGQTPFTELIRYGAAGSSGTVAEPFAIAAKFPSPFIHVHYAQGACLAEAFYQSVSGPYQLLIVGDPLCRPWKPKPSGATKPRSESTE